MAVPTFVARTETSGAGLSYSQTEPAHANGDMLLAQILIVIGDTATRTITGHGTKITQHGGGDLAGYNNGFILSMFWWIGNGTATSRTWSTTENNMLTWYVRIIAYRGPTEIVGFTTYQDYYAASAWTPTWDCPGITSSTDAVSMVIHGSYGGTGPSGPGLAPSGYTTEAVNFPYEWRRMATAQTFDPGAHTGTQVSAGTARSLHVVARSAIPPNAPTLGAPAANAQVLYHRSITFSWTHNSNEGQAQTSYTLRIEEPGGANRYYWNGSSWTTSAVNAGSTSAQSVTIASLPPALAGASIDWYHATDDAGGSGPYAAPRRLHPGFEGFGGAMV